MSSRIARLCRRAIAGLNMFGRGASARWKQGGAPFQVTVVSFAVTLVALGVTLAACRGARDDAATATRQVADLHGLMNSVKQTADMSLAETRRVLKSLAVSETPTPADLTRADEILAKAQGDLGRTASVSPSRYAVTGCGSIRDSATDLEWFVGPDIDVSWDEAETWLDALATCGATWRLPEAEELHALYSDGSTAGTGFVRGGSRFPAKIDPVFNGIGGGSWVWTAQELGARIARAVNLYENVDVSLDKDTDLPVRAFAVRLT